MVKLARKFMAHYIDASVPEDNDQLFELFGEGVEEFKPEMSAKVTKMQNILGQTEVMITGYEKTCEVGTFYANQDTELYDRLMRIIDEQHTMESLGTKVVDVYLWRPRHEHGYYAALEYAYIEVKSYGGDATGLQIPFTLHYTGKRQEGYFDPDTKMFTPMDEE